MGPGGDTQRKYRLTEKDGKWIGRGVNTYSHQKNKGTGKGQQHKTRPYVQGILEMK